MSTANGHGPYTTPNGNYASQMRKQFSRQNSSFGGGHGHVHNMAVMVVPNKVDYSVTKGGVRFWAVLFVFIFLCSAMLTVFTEIDDDDEDHPVHASSPDDTDNDSEVLTETVSRIADDEDDDGDTRESNPPDPGPQTEEEDGEEENIDDNDDEEEAMLAKLKEKSQKYSTKRGKKEKPVVVVKVQDEEDDDEIEVQQAPPQRQSRRRRQRVEDAKEEVEEVQLEKEEDEEPEPMEREQPKKARRRRRKEQKVEPNDEDDDEDSEAVAVAQQRHGSKLKVEDDDQDDDEEDEKDEKTGHKHVLLDDDEDDDDDDGPAPTAQPSRHKPGKTPKKKATSWKRTVNQEDDLQPRKNLLKHQKPKPRQQADETPTNSSDNEIDDDEDEEDDADEQNLKEEARRKPETQEVTSIRKKGTQYNRKAITNRDDYKHRTTLDSADYLLEKHDFASASALYRQVLDRNRHSPRAHFGIARGLQLRSEFEGNDSLLDAAVAEYQVVLEDDDTPETLFKLTAENVIDCARYRGNLHKVMIIQRMLLDRFPDDLAIQNDFGVTFLMMGRVEDAKNIFASVLETDPSNPSAQAYYGYILKVHDSQLEKGVMYMRRGLKASSEAIVDAKFFFHLGDGLMRLGRHSEATRVYEEATHLGLFPSPLQRSFHNLEGLVARPWWTLEQTGCGKHLKHVERQWTVIREEAVSLLEKRSILFEPEELHWTDGSQEAFYLTRDTNFDEKNCKLTPNTCTILKKFAETSECFKGDLKISLLHSGSRIWPHCGPTNYVLEAQLGLWVPSEARIRVATDIKGWKTGKMIVFDESFEHEIWFDGAPANAKRIVLSMNLWHPQVPSTSRFDPVRG